MSKKKNPRETAGSGCLLCSGMVGVVCTLLNSLLSKPFYPYPAVCLLCSEQPLQTWEVGPTCGFLLCSSLGCCEDPIPAGNGSGGL